MRRNSDGLGQSDGGGRLDPKSPAGALTGGLPLDSGGAAAAARSECRAGDR